MTLSDHLLHYALTEPGRWTASTVAADLRLLPATVSSEASRLRQIGLLGPARNGRACHLYLTPEGIRWVGLNRPEWRGADGRPVVRLSRPGDVTARARAALGVLSRFPEGVTSGVVGDALGMSGVSARNLLAALAEAGLCLRLGVHGPTVRWRPLTPDELVGALEERLVEARRAARTGRAA